MRGVLVACLLLAGCRCGAREATTSDAGRLAPVETATSLPELPRETHGLPAEVRETVLATIDERSITVLDYVDDYERLRGTQRHAFAMPATRAQLLEARIREELLADEARRRGLDAEPEVQRAREEAMRAALVRLLREEHPTPAPTEPELLALYAEHPSRFSRPERRSAHYLRGTRAEAETALALARTASNPVRALREWSERQISPTVAMGELEPVADPRTGWRGPAVPRAVGIALFEGSPGTLIDEVVEGDGAFYVLIPTSALPATQLSFEEARPALVRLYEERAFERMLETALPEAQVSIDEDALAAVRPPAR